MSGTRVFPVKRRFPDARAVLRDGHEKPNHAVAACQGKFSRDTVYELYGDDRADHSFTVRTQEKLIELVFNAGREEYGDIARKIVQSPEGVDLIREHLGSYNYWRHNIQGALVSGGIHIYETDGYFQFLHFNSRLDAPVRRDEEELDADHEGYVFALNNRLHFHGMGPHYIRPAIANAVESVFDEYVDGLVLTVQRKTLALMSARFIMIHSEHPDFYIDEGNSKKFKSIQREIKRRILTSNRVQGVLITADE